MLNRKFDCCMFFCFFSLGGVGGQDGAKNTLSAMPAERLVQRVWNAQVQTNVYHIGLLLHEHDWFICRIFDEKWSRPLFVAASSYPRSLRIVSSLAKPPGNQN